MTLPCDETNPDSLLLYAKQILNKTLRDFVDDSIIEKFQNNRKRKGEYWDMIEKYYFEKELDSKSEPDFPKAWLELKTTPRKKLKNWWKVPKERLVMNMINFKSIVKETRKTSSFLKKNAKLLLMVYLYEKEKLPRDYIVEIVNIWNFYENEKDLLMIEKDWQFIQDKIKDGRAHELSEWDTLYLWACTKAADSKKRTSQPFSSESAKPRAFSLKAWYIKTVIERILNKEQKKESILVDLSVLKKESFESYIKRKFDAYVWMTPQEIADKIWVKLSKSKQYLDILSKRILWIKWNDIEEVEEFKKGNMSMRTMRLNMKGTPKEGVSFPAFDYREIAYQNWYDSDLLQTMDKRFFFVIYQYDKNKKLTLKKVMFWNVPYNDLNDTIQKVFEDTKKNILDWDYENFVKISNKRIVHVRPKGANWETTNEWPDWKKHPTKCFWLNAKYIADKI